MFAGSFRLGKVDAPLAVFGDLLKEFEATAYERGDSGDDEALADLFAEPSEGHGETQLIDDECLAIDLAELMVVLVADEVSAARGVLKEIRTLVACDRDFVQMWQAEAPASEDGAVAGAERAFGFAANGAHLESEGRHASVG